MALNDVRLERRNLDQVRGTSNFGVVGQNGRLSRTSSWYRRAFQHVVRGEYVIKNRTSHAYLCFLEKSNISVMIWSP